MSIVFEIDASSGDVTTAGNITVSGGNGTGATATATNNISDIASFTIVDPGSGYVAVPTTMPASRLALLL